MQQIIEQKSVLMNMTNKPTNAKHIYGSVSKYIVVAIAYLLW